jgi:hypothetical protein
MHSPTDGANSKAHTYQKLPMDLPTDGADSKAHTYQKLPTDLPMRTCSDAQLPMVLPTDVENYGGIFEIFGAEIN